MKFLGQGFSKLDDEQDRQTDRQIDTMTALTKRIREWRSDAISIAQQHLQNI